MYPYQIGHFPSLNAMKENINNNTNCLCNEAWQKIQDLAFIILRVTGVLTAQCQSNHPIVNTTYYKQQPFIHLGINKKDDCPSIFHLIEYQKVRVCLWPVMNSFIMQRSIFESKVYIAIYIRWGGQQATGLEFWLYVRGWSFKSSSS